MDYAPSVQSQITDLNEKFDKLLKLVTEKPAQRGACFLCHQPGHFANRCPNQQQPSRSSRNPVNSVGFAMPSVSPVGDLYVPPSPNGTSFGTAPVPAHTTGAAPHHPNGFYGPPPARGAAGGYTNTRQGAWYPETRNHLNY